MVLAKAQSGVDWLFCTGGPQMYTKGCNPFHQRCRVTIDPGSPRRRRLVYAESWRLSLLASPGVEVLRVVPQLRQTVTVRVHRHEDRLYDARAKLALQLLRDGAHLHQLRRADVRAVAEPEVQEDELAVEVLVGHGPTVHIDQGEGSAERGLAGRGHFRSHALLLLVPLHPVVAHG